jgi:hypothetical protein
MPPEIQKLGRTIRQWFDKICNYHLARVSYGPTESLNNLIERIKTHRFRLPQLRELPDPGPALRRQAELASAGLDRCPVRCWTPPDSEEPEAAGHPPGPLPPLHGPRRPHCSDIARD